MDIKLFASEKDFQDSRAQHMPLSGNGVDRSVAYGSCTVGEGLGGNGMMVYFPDQLVSFLVYESGHVILSNDDDSTLYGYSVPEEVMTNIGHMVEAL